MTADDQDARDFDVMNTIEGEVTCLTCRTQVHDGRCMCWVHLAHALQRYAGMGHDESAQAAADIWDADGNPDDVWAGTYLNNTVPGHGTPDAIVAALAASEVPGDSEHGDCLLCDAPGGGGYYLHLTTCYGHGDPAHAACIANTDKTAPTYRVKIPDIDLPSSHKPSCPWRQAKEWQAR